MRFSALIVAWLSAACGSSVGSEELDAALADGAVTIDSSIDAIGGECGPLEGCTACEYTVAPSASTECYCLGCPSLALTDTECTNNRASYNTFCKFKDWPESTDCPVFDCPSVEAECGPAGSCQLAGCSADPPAAIEPMPGGLPNHQWGEGLPLVVDLQACVPGRWFVWLPLGSAWVVVSASGNHCELWLGGETEDPLYDGSPTRQCRFTRGPTCQLHIEQPAPGGPTFLNNPGCFGVSAAQ